MRTPTPTPTPKYTHTWGSCSCHPVCHCLRSRGLPLLLDSLAGKRIPHILGWLVAVGGQHADTKRGAVKALQRRKQVIWERAVLLAARLGVWINYNLHFVARRGALVLGEEKKLSV